MRIGIKTSTPNKQLSRRPVLLANIKAGDNLYKQNKTWNLTNTISLYLHNKITKTLYNNLSRYNNGSDHYIQMACNKNRTKSDSIWFT